MLHLAAAAEGGQVCSGKVQMRMLWFWDVFEGAPPRDEKGQGGPALSSGYEQILLEYPVSSGSSMAGEK